MLVPVRLGLRRTGRTHYRPNSSLTSGVTCSALGLQARPVSHRATAWRCALHARSEKAAGHFAPGARSVPSGTTTARARWDFAPFGAVMKDAPGSRHKSCYLQCRPVAVSRWRGNPRHTGPRRLIACLAAAGATQPDLRRPGALKITASCVQRPLRACHAHCLRPAALTLRPRRPRSARASRSGILHASPSLRCLDQ